MRKQPGPVHLTTMHTDNPQNIMHFKVAVRQAREQMLVVTCAVSGVGGMINETQNKSIIFHQPIQLQRASRDTCLYTSASICWLLFGFC